VVKVTVDPFAPLTAARRTGLDRAFGEYAAFLGRRLALSIRDPAP
jgi:hypothetical protein